MKNLNEDTYWTVTLWFFRQLGSQGWTLGIREYAANEGQHEYDAGKGIGQLNEQVLDEWFDVFECVARDQALRHGGLSVRMFDQAVE